MFKVAGLSRKDGELKLRFANDLVSRCKVLQRNGHKDIDLVELPQAMSKDQAVAYMSGLEQFSYIEAQAVFADYQSKNAPKAKTPKVAVASKELDVEFEPETQAQKDKRERDAARKRDNRAKAKVAPKQEDLDEA